MTDWIDKAALGIFAKITDAANDAGLSAKDALGIITVDAIASIIQKHVPTRDLMNSHLGVAAYSWWLSKRPLGWSERDHLNDVTVNVTTDVEKALARAVAVAVVTSPPEAP